MKQSFASTMADYTASRLRQFVGGKTTPYHTRWGLPPVKDPWAYMALKAEHKMWAKT